MGGEPTAMATDRRALTLTPTWDDKEPPLGHALRHAKGPDAFLLQYNSLDSRTPQPDNNILFDHLNRLTILINNTKNPITRN